MVTEQTIQTPSQRRGQLTPRIQAKALKLLGREIDTAELRLMPYMQYVMVNDQKLDPNKVNAQERAILQRWREAGYLEGGASGAAITREFWDILTEETARHISFPLWEIEIAARAAEKILAEGWPVTYEAFVANGRVAP